MQAAASYALQSYATVQRDVGVMGADSHQLILMLFDGAGVAVADAKKHLAGGNIAGKCASIDKASMIINDGLRASLDLNAGGQLAKQLHDLYGYMGQRLLQANLRNERAALDEVLRLLSELRGAWASINTSGRRAGPTASVAQLSRKT
jgi:flagellar secretion chaperone FliS